MHYLGVGAQLEHAVVRNPTSLLHAALQFPAMLVNLA
jgi:hypothetical protein